MFNSQCNFSSLNTILEVTVQVSCKLDRKYTFDLTRGTIPFAKLEDEIRHEVSFKSALYTCVCLCRY